MLPYLFEYTVPMSEPCTTYFKKYTLKISGMNLLKYWNIHVRYECTYTWCREIKQPCS